MCRRLMCSLALFAVGCSSRPAGVDSVDVDPSKATNSAMELYDSNADGFLDAEELKQVPGVLAWLDRYDQDNDGKVSSDELRARLRSWSDMGLGFRSLPVHVVVDGEPLAGATVKFVPEPYLGDAVKPAEGVTLPDGIVNVSVAQEDLPTALKERGRNFYGVTNGTFKIVITHPEKELPSKFNTATEVGVEIATDTVRHSLHLDLKSR